MTTQLPGDSRFHQSTELSITMTHFRHYFFHQPHCRAHPSFSALPWPIPFFSRGPHPSSILGHLSSPSFPFSLFWSCLPLALKSSSLCRKSFPTWQLGRIYRSVLFFYSVNGCAKHCIICLKCKNKTWPLLSWSLVLRRLFKKSQIKQAGGSWTGFWKVSRS